LNEETSEKVIQVERLVAAKLVVWPEMCQTFKKTRTNLEYGVEV